MNDNSVSIFYRRFIQLVIAGHSEISASFAFSADTLSTNKLLLHSGGGHTVPTDTFACRAEIRKIYSYKLVYNNKTVKIMRWFFKSWKYVLIENIIF